MKKPQSLCKLLIACMLGLFMMMACIGNQPSSQEQYLKATISAMETQVAHSQQPSQPTPTLDQSREQQLQATVVALQTQVSEKNEPTPTPFGLTNPTGIVPAGQTVIMDGFSLVVKPSFKIKEGGKSKTLIYIEMVVTNISGRSRLFSYNRPLSLSMKDNLGTIYQPFDNASDFYQAFQFSIDDGKTVSFESAYNAHSAHQIQVFEGVIPPGANQLIITFVGFGPFSGFEVSLDL